MRLVVQGVECYYNSVKVLENVSFTVTSGHFLGIIGPNGSGKTTLLKTIAGVLKPKVGSVLIDNQEIHKLKRVEVAQKIGVVPQNPSTSFNFTVLDVVLMGRNPYLERMKGEGLNDLLIAKQAMKLTGTLHLANRYIEELSGGERQRVIIARALAQNPKVLLLDEPTQHLDINHQLEIMGLLVKLCKENMLTVIMVIHDINLAARYCDSIIVMKQGRIIAMGSCEETLTKQNIEEAFSINVVVKRHPITGSLYIVPLQKITEKRPVRKLKIHLICGGGTGGVLMRKIVDEGFELTAGVLNVIDSDYETAEALGIPTVCEAPFSPITDENHKNNMDLICKADVVLVANTPFGFSNIRNLEAAKEALEKGKKVVVIQETPCNERDYTGGIASDIFRRLEKKGAIFVENQEKAITIIKALEEGLSLVETKPTFAP